MEELLELKEHYQNKLYTAIRKTAEEVDSGIEIEELEAKIDYARLQKDTEELLAMTYSQSEREIVNLIRNKYPV